MNSVTPMPVRPLQLSRAFCRVCQVYRWDDGTRCIHCGNYQNPFLKYDSLGDLRDTRYSEIDGRPAVWFRVKTGEGDERP